MLHFMRNNYKSGSDTFFPIGKHRSNIIRMIFVILCCFGFFFPNWSQAIKSSPIELTHQWERTNPGGGGAVSTIGAGPGGLIVAGSDLSGAYLSTDRGQSWRVAGASAGLTETHISGIGFDPFDPNFVYLGTEGGIFRSSDGAITFTRVLDHGYITDIECAPSNPSVCYAAYHPQFDSTRVWFIAQLIKGSPGHRSVAICPAICVS